jgi:Fe2+ transport system protein FeoA
MKRLAKNFQKNSWQGFTFLCATVQSPICVDEPGHSSLYLSQTKVGDRLQITKICCSQCVSELAHQGLASGSKVEVASVTPNGSIIVTLGDKNIGLGAAIAHQILVTHLNPISIE